MLGIKQFASTVGSINLVKASDKFLQKHFKAVSESEEFLGAGFDEVLDLVERDELHVLTEETVFLAVLRYDKYCLSKHYSNYNILLRSGGSNRIRNLAVNTCRFSFRKSDFHY